MKETYAIIGFLSGGRQTIRESGTQDSVYGLSGKKVRAPEYLRMVKDGVVLSGAATLAELNKPKWGNGSQTIEEVLPVLPAAVPECLPAPFWEWNTYDPAKPPTKDPYEIWSGLSGNSMYWELEGEQLGQFFQGAGNSVHITDDDGKLTIWERLGVKRYRRMKQGNEPAYIPNPQWESVQAERAEKAALYDDIIRSILTPVGHYQFRGLPTGDDPKRTDPTKFGYGWRINGADIPVDPQHRLAVPSWGFKFLEAPMRNPENVVTNYRDSKTGERYTKVVDHYEQTLRVAIRDSLDVAPYEKRMKVLLGL